MAQHYLRHYFDVKRVLIRIGAMEHPISKCDHIRTFVIGVKIVTNCCWIEQFHLLIFVARACKRLFVYVLECLKMNTSAIFSGDHCSGEGENCSTIIAPPQKLRRDLLRRQLLQRKLLHFRDNCSDDKCSTSGTLISATGTLAIITPPTFYLMTICLTSGALTALCYFTLYP